MIGMFIQDWWRHSFRVACWNVRHFGEHYTPLTETEASALLVAAMDEANDPARVQSRTALRTKVISRGEGQSF